MPDVFYSARAPKARPRTPAAMAFIFAAAPVAVGDEGDVLAADDAGPVGVGEALVAVVSPTPSPMLVSNFKCKRFAA